MKKILILIIGLLFTVCCLSAEPTYKSFGFDLSIPLLSESGEENDISTELTMRSVGFGIHSQTLYTEKVGLFVDLNFFFPQKMTLKVSQGASSYSDVLTREDFDSLWGMSFLGGPSFAVSRGEGHIFTISPGIHYNLVSMKGDGGASAVYMFGTGVNFQNNMKINERVYVDIGLELTYDFICMVITSGDTNSDVSYDVTCVPKIGLGFFL